MYYSQIRVDPSNNQNIWVLGTELYLSKDGGKTFESENTARDVHVDHHAMWVDPRDGRHVILGNDGGFYVTYDQGANWDHHNHVAIGQFYHVAVGPRRNYSVYGGLQDNGSWGGPSRSADGGGPVNTDWVSIGSGDGFVCQVDPLDPDQIYAESQGGATTRINLRTGEQRFMRTRPQRGTTYRFNWKTPFILSPHNSKVYYSAGNYVFRSPFKGDGLKAISPDIARTDDGTASALAESPVEEGVLYVGTTDGSMWNTKDGGHTWVNLYGQPEQKKQPAGPEAGAASDTAPPGEPGEGDPSRGPGRMLEMLKQRDANGDGKLQKEEFPEQMLRMFERLDANTDGVIDEEELKAMPQRFGRRGRGRPSPEERPKRQSRAGTTTGRTSTSARARTCGTAPAPAPAGTQPGPAPAEPQPAASGTSTGASTSTCGTTTGARTAPAEPQPRQAPAPAGTAARTSTRRTSTGGAACRGSEASSRTACSVGASTAG